ncbi:ATP-binding protein [Laspinema palackyanum]|uniref:ATP-binding protein n=1 Tax=Laspinema palackyanum TaxID=3231601 RepID=UPI00345DEFC7|nr:ATP-binding protein [Laspinema sp. D2c]
MERKFIEFYKVTNIVSKRVSPLDLEARKYYVDLSPVIGNEVEKIHDKIIITGQHEPTCTVLTGYIDSGKSTELLRLKHKLEVAGFHVVYFEAYEDLDMIQVSIAHIWLAIACRIVQSLETIEIKTPKKLNKFLQESLQIFYFDVQEEIKEAISKNVRLKLGKDGDIFTWCIEMREVIKNSQKKSFFYQPLSQFWNSQKSELIEAINQELIEPLVTQIKAQGKQGLVVIGEGLDGIYNIRLPGGQVQTEYLFVDQGEYLTKLNCHVVYTLPISLVFSNHYEMLTQHFGELRVLPMVPVRSREGQEHQEGMARLRQLVLIKAFPELDEQQRLEAISLVFENAEALDRLCRISGGHIRNLAGLLYRCVMEGEDFSFPLKRQALEKVIDSYKEDLRAAINEEEWELLREVKTSQMVKIGDSKYQMLIRSMFVLKYGDGNQEWFDINPVLSEAEEMQK